MVLAISQLGDYNVSCNGSSDGYLKITSIPGYDDVSGFTFYTTGPDGFTSPFRFMNGIKAGDYHITISHSEGCTGEKDTTLSQPDPVETGSITGDTEFVHDSNYLYSLSDASTGSTWSWSVEGGEIWAGQGSKTVAIEWRTSQTGKVKVVEMNENGCLGDTVYLGTKYYLLSGIEPIQSSVKIYPNPVVNNLYIKGLKNYSGSVEFYSLLGKMALRMNLQEELNIEALDKGVYYLRLKDRNEQVILTQKIIKK
jgi:hypothetical protein